jgi:predicted double-glycine peptidase
MPQDSRLVLDLPFYPDDSRLCGPASLAAVMNYMGYPVTMEEVANGVQRWDLRGSIGPDLVIWARSRGARARFYSAKPEDLLDFVNRQIPVVVQVDEGVGPVVMGHFMVVAGYTFDGVVVNNGLVQQEVIEWGRFLSQWYKMGNFTIVVDAPEKTGASAGAAASAPAAPSGGPDALDGASSSDAAASPGGTASPGSPTASGAAASPGSQTASGDAASFGSPAASGPAASPGTPVVSGVAASPGTPAAFGAKASSDASSAYGGAASSGSPVASGGKASSGYPPASGVAAPADASAASGAEASSDPTAVSGAVSPSDTPAASGGTDGPGAAGGSSADMAASQGGPVPAGTRTGPPPGAAAQRNLTALSEPPDGGLPEALLGDYGAPDVIPGGGGI